MQTHFPALFRSIAGGLAALPFTAFAWEPGTYPDAPSRMHSSGFSVNSNSRNDVLAFWHAVYQASEGYEERVKWTGNYQGDEGSTSAAFVNDVERRINYFRAMCGVPANVKVNADSTVFIKDTDAFKPARSTPKSDAAQAAAMMLILNYNPTTGANPAISHDPPKTLAGWSPAAWNANANSNLALGMYGPNAISAYMIEEQRSSSSISFWNNLVGHRRWCLYPPATDFATGDQPGASVTRLPTNVLYIFQHPAELQLAPTPGFVAYPAPGYFPAPINSRFWSLSHAGADFTSAKVKMTDSNGKSVTISGVRNSTTYGDPAIVWEVAGAAASKTVFADTTFDVKVSGVGGTGVPSSFSYSVTLIHPDRITSPQSISGPATAISNRTTDYNFTPPKGAEALQVASFLQQSSPWTEDAETPADAQVIDGTAENYPLLAETASFAGFGGVAGQRAFRLTFPTNYDLIVQGVPEQSFEIKRDILTKANARLRFLYRRGYMSTTSSLQVETSTNGGVTWKSLGAPVTGVSNMHFDAAVSSADFALPQSDQPVRVRFRYFLEPGTSLYAHDAYPTSPTGIFIDNITTANCSWLEVKKTHNLAKKSNSFGFSATTAGSSLVEGSQWRLGLRTKLGRKWFAYGPLKAVRITAP